MTALRNILTFWETPLIYFLAKTVDKTVGSTLTSAWEQKITVFLQILEKEWTRVSWFCPEEAKFMNQHK